MQIIDAVAQWPDWKGPGEIDIHMNIVQNFEFLLKQKTNGEYVLVPKLESEDPSVQSITTTVTVSKGVTIFEVCLGLALSIFSSVLDGVGEVFDAASTVAVESAESAVITITKEVIKGIAEEIGKLAVMEIEESAAESASDAVENSDESGFETKFANAITAHKWKIYGGVLGAALSVPADKIPEYIKLVAAGNLDAVPSFNAFADSSSGPIKFPGSTGLDLKTFSLNGPLIITGNLK